MFLSMNALKMLTSSKKGAKEGLCDEATYLKFEVTRLVIRDEIFRGGRKSGFTVYCRVLPL